MLETFINKKFTKAHERVIRQVNEIIEEYQAAGYSLTLRQIYYQMVAADMIDNEYREYKRVGEIIKDARRAGLIDWDAIEDRTRFMRGLNTWDSVEQILTTTAGRFRYDVWEKQKVHVEVWVEKDALIGVVERVCNRYRVDYFACRGYVSDPELYSAGKRLSAFKREGYKVVVLHLGDHDPSGMQMTEDNLRRTSLFAGQEIDIRRIALSMEQIAEYSPPPQWAKKTDSRHPWYVKKFDTDRSWELDSLKPQIIDKLVAENIEELISDKDVWRADIVREEIEKENLRQTASHWDEARLRPWHLPLYSYENEQPLYDAGKVKPFRWEGSGQRFSQPLQIMLGSHAAKPSRFVDGFMDYSDNTWWRGEPGGATRIDEDYIEGWRFAEPEVHPVMPWDKKEETADGES